MAKTPFIMKKGANRITDLIGGQAAYGLGVGNVYYVMQSNQTIYPQFYEDYQTEYSDGTYAVHSTIQSALNATTAERNDYVIVMPDSNDYDLSTALTMSKRNVHLICPSGLGTNGFPTNAARLHMTDSDATSYHIVVTADCTEIAGFFFKSDSTSIYSQIHLSGTRWHNVIHDNFFGLADTASSAHNAIHASGAASHFSIYDNFFTNYNPGLVTGTNNNVNAFINISSASSTRGLIRGNLLLTGVNTTVAAGINCSGTGCFILQNYLYENAGGGGIDAGVFTLGINAATDSFCADNRIGIATAANAVDGGTNNKSWVTNYYGAAGGTLASDSTA